MAKKKIMRKNGLSVFSHKLFQEAQKYLVGGVNSPVRSFSYVGGDPILIKKGRGPYVWDEDNRKYIDYVLSWGAMILGHAHPIVTRDVKKQIESGMGFGATHRLEIELAGMIRAAIPFVEKIRFVNSGTEAVMGAVRLARGYTKRDKIIKFQRSYHGHADYLLVKGGSGLATLQIPSSAGVPKSFIKDTLVAPYGNSRAVENIFKKYAGRIAAVLVEPVGGNDGVVLPDIDFLNRLRRLTRKNNALLIFDEVITGFRFRFGSGARELGIRPDLICLGKVIGGGLPVGAYGGKEKIMDHLAPLGKVYQASTFAGNPVVMRAGLSALTALKESKSDYARAKELTAYLTSRLRKEAGRVGVDLKITTYGTMFSLRFSGQGVFRQFHRRMLEGGVYLAPSEFEANFLSLAHTKRDIDRTILAAKKAFLHAKKFCCGLSHF